MSPAQQNGIRPGMVILEVDGTQVSTPQEAAGRLEQLEEGAVTGLLLATPGGREVLTTLRAGLRRAPSEGCPGPAFQFRGI